MERPSHSLLRALVTAAVALAGMAGIISVWLGSQRGVVPLPTIEEGVEVVILGNSIALANVEADRVKAAMARRPGVSQLAERGSQPAHWLALVRHRLFAAGHRPRDVVVVSPLELLVRERLSSSRDTARLLALLTQPDPALWEVAVGTDGMVAFWGRQRELFRFLSLSALTSWLPHTLGLQQELSAARARQSPIPRDPTQRPAWIVDPGAPSRGRAERDPGRREPVSKSTESWHLLPELIDETRRHDAHLWVVVPPLDPRQRRASCSRNALQESIAVDLQARGVTLLDLTDADVPAAWFATRSHLEGDGPAWMSDTLARHLMTRTGGRPGCT